jgi:hypothetical protein
MTNDPLRIANVAVLSDRPALHVIFGDQYAAVIDLSDWIATTKALSPLKDPALFAKARVGEHGTAVVWIDDVLDLGADNLRNLATEQSGGIGHERMIEWMHRNNLTQKRTVEAIGISRRMLNYYLAAVKPIPQIVWLACLGWESLAKRRRPNVRRQGVTSVHHA